MGVYHLTGVKGSGLKVCIFLVESDRFTPGAWIVFSRCELIWIGSLQFCSGSDDFTSGMWMFPLLLNSPDWKSALLYLGLTVLHDWGECFHTCEQLWIRSLHFRTWVLRFHTSCVSFFTTVNSSGLEVFIFVFGSDNFTSRVWIFSQMWTALDSEDLLLCRFCLIVSHLRGEFIHLFSFLGIIYVWVQMVRLLAGVFSGLLFFPVNSKLLYCFNRFCHKVYVG